MAVCKEKIAAKAHQLSADGKFSWEEVECLGSCANAPMAQIGKDYYEDLTPARMGEIIDELAAGRVPVPGPQNGRFASEPKAGLTSLKDRAGEAHNGSVALALSIGDTVKRIDGTEVPLRAPWQRSGEPETPPEFTPPIAHARAVRGREEGPPRRGQRDAREHRRPAGHADRAAARGGRRPDEAQGVGPKAAKILNSLGVLPLRPDRRLDRGGHRLGGREPRHLPRPPGAGRVGRTGEGILPEGRDRRSPDALKAVSG
jgi:NADH-quinone oxidoreductase subunit E